MDFVTRLSDQDFGDQSESLTASDLPTNDGQVSLAVDSDKINDDLKPDVAELSQTRLTRKCAWCDDCSSSEWPRKDTINKRQRMIEKEDTSLAEDGEESCTNKPSTLLLPDVVEPERHSLAGQQLSLPIDNIDAGQCYPSWQADHKFRNIERLHQLNGLDDLMRQLKLESSRFSGDHFYLDRLSELCDTMAEFSYYNIHVSSTSLDCVLKLARREIA